MSVADKVHVHVGQQLRRRRLLLNLTQAQVAAACDIRFQQVQKYESGVNRISVGRLWQIAQALDVPVSYFFSGLPKLHVPQPSVPLQIPPSRRHA